MHKHYVQCVCHQSVLGSGIDRICVAGMVGVVHHTPAQVAAAITTQVGEFVIAVPPYPERPLIAKHDGGDDWVESAPDTTTVNDLDTRPECNGLDGEAHELTYRYAGVDT
jgi:hypothetical protein